MIKNPEDQKDNPFYRWSTPKRANVEVENGDSGAPPMPLNTVTPDERTGKMLTSVEADRLSMQAGPASQKTLTDEDMPAIETLDASSDFSGFMAPGVSAKLRKLALKKLFAGAGFNIRDGLDDYDDDFTNFEPLGDIITWDMQQQAERLSAEQAEQEMTDADETNSPDAPPDNQTDTQQINTQQVAEVADTEAPTTSASKT